MNFGNIFHRASEVLKEKMEQGENELLANTRFINEKSDLDVNLYVAIIANAALACEYYIKSMLPNNTKEQMLDSLFQLLDENIQEEIKNSTIEKMNVSNAFYSDNDFQRDLADNSDLFLKCHCFHKEEIHPTSFLFVTNFMESLYEILKGEK